MSSYALMTNTGRNKEAAALANGTTLEITEIAWGDGDRFPSGGEATLLNEQGRKLVQGTGLVDGALNTAFFEILLDVNEGPFVVREAGLFDADGDLIAIAKYDPPVNKPKDSVTALIRINVVFSDLENLILKVQSTDAYVPIERKLTAREGLIGGGDLSENRLLSVDFATIAETELGKARDKVISPALLASLVAPYTALTNSIIPPGRFVWSSDGTLMQNATNAAITITGRDKATLISNGLVEYFSKLQSDTIAIASPVGAVMAFAMSATPAGWLECNGAAISRASYPALFAAIGTTYGAGNGSTTFNLPDLRGEFLRGWDHGRGVDSGRGLGSAQAGAVERHNHYIPTSSGGTENGSVAFKDNDESTWTFNSSINVYPKTGYVITTYDIGANNYQWTGGNWASETRPRNIALMFCIKY